MGSELHVSSNLWKEQVFFPQAKALQVHPELVSHMRCHSHRLGHLLGSVPPAFVQSALALIL